jgi:hypothetical protein
MDRAWDAVMPPLRRDYHILCFEKKETQAIVTVPLNTQTGKKDSFRRRIVVTKKAGKLYFRRVQFRHVHERLPVLSGRVNQWRKA